MEDGDDTAAAMAQAMGFSSFGAQPNSNKRRKFNPRADAIVDNGVVPVSKTGSNTTPLGVRNRSNHDEIDLDDDDDEELGGLSGEVPSHPKGELEGGAGDNSGPQYLDTSRPSTVDVVDEIQSQIDNIVGAPAQWPGVESSPTVGTIRSSVSGRGSGSNRGGRVRREEYQVGDWWVGYYDPSSNINPWEALEKSRGLEPRGNWMTWDEAKAAKA